MVKSFFLILFLAIFIICFDEAISKWAGCLHFEWRCCPATVLRREVTLLFGGVCYCSMSVGRPLSVQSSSGFWGDAQLAHSIVRMSCEVVEVSDGYSVDFVLDEWYFGVCVECVVADISWCVEHHSQYFGLHSLYDFCVGRLGTAPKLYTVGPYRFIDRFVQ
jgi:hypothetical protein